MPEETEIATKMMEVELCFAKAKTRKMEAEAEMAELNLKAMKIHIKKMENEK